MGINALNLNRVLANTTKSNTKSSGNNTFDKVFEKNNQANQSNKSNEITANNQADESKPKDIKKSKSDDVDDSKNKPISKEEKSALREAGMSDDEINGIESDQDLKETIIKKLLGGELKDTEDTNSLLAILMTLMNGNFDITDYTKIKNFVKENYSELINIISNCVVEGMSNIDLTQNPKDQLNLMLKLHGDLQSADKLKSSDVLQALNLNSDNILEKIQSEFSSIFKEELKDLNLSNNTMYGKIEPELVEMLKSKLSNVDTNKKEEKDLAKPVKLDTQNIQSEKQINVIAKTDSKSADTNLMMENDSSKSDEDFLKNLLSNNNNDKITKVTNFMAQFNNTRVENTNAAQIENLIVNKNNFSEDMIKSIKYMEFNNMKDLTVKINPKELGEVVIKLTMEAGAMKATITAANKEAYNLLNSNLADMTNKLQNSDIKVQNLALNIYNEDTTFFKDGSNNGQSHEENKGKRNHAVGTILEEETVDNVSSIDSNVNMLA